MNKLVVTILLLLLTCAPLAAAENPFLWVRAKDISDRVYEEALIGLLDNAKESITISMYILRLGEHPKHPINRLMKDLEEALDRGVSVNIYLNSKIDRSGHSVPAGIARGPAFDALRAKGAQIHLTTAHYALHDKLVIVDERYIAAGSANWSASGLNYNFETNFLIDSPVLAKGRLRRMKTIHLKGESLRDPPQDSLREIHPLPEVIQLPSALMQDRHYLPRMLTKRDNRAMDLYLLLIAESHRRRAKEFPVSLEKLSARLNMPQDWSPAALRRQVIKSLRKLKNRYGLIDVRFQHARAAGITLIDIKGETFPLKRGFFDPSFLAEQRQNRKFVLLIEACLKAEGKDITNFSQRELAKMFSVNERTIRKGTK